MEARTAQADEDRRARDIQADFRGMSRPAIHDRPRQKAGDAEDGETDDAPYDGSGEGGRHDRFAGSAHTRGDTCGIELEQGHWGKAGQHTDNADEQTTDEALSCGSLEANV